MKLLLQSGVSFLPNHLSKVDCSRGKEGPISLFWGGGQLSASSSSYYYYFRVLAQLPGGREGLMCKILSPPHKKAQKTPQRSRRISLCIMYHIGFVTYHFFSKICKARLQGRRSKNLQSLQKTNKKRTSKSGSTGRQVAKKGDRNTRSCGRKKRKVFLSPQHPKKEKKESEEEEERRTSERMCSHPCSRAAQDNLMTDQLL